MSTCSETKHTSGLYFSNTSSKVIWLSVIVAVACYLCSPIISTNLYRSIAVGRWILTFEKMPTEDLWSYAGTGVSWVNTSWAFDVLIASIERSFGLQGLSVFKIVLSVLFLAISSALYSVLSGSVFFGTLVAVLVACGVLVSTDLEPWLLQGVCFLIIVFLLLSLRRFFLKAVAMLLIFTLILNSGSGVIGILLSLLLCVWSLPFPGKERLSFSFLLLSALFLTPYGASLVFHAAKEEAFLIAQSFLTWSSFQAVVNFQSAFLGLLWVLYIALGRNRRKVSPMLFIISLFLSLLSLVAFHYAFIALLVIGVMLSLSWNQLEAGKEVGLSQGILKLKNQLSTFPVVGSVWLLFCISVVSVLSTFRSYAIDVGVPDREVSMINESSFFPLLHPVEVGGYLIHRFSGSDGAPLNKIFADDRSLRINQAIGLLASEVLSERVDISEISEQFSPSAVLCRSTDALCQSLSEDSGWERIESKDQVFSSELERRMAKVFSWSLYKKVTPLAER